MEAATTTYDPHRQRMDALAAANETRLARAKMKRQIKRGRLRITSVIMDPPWYAETMLVAELLAAQARWGNARSHKHMRRVALPLTKTVGALTERQRRALVAVLP